MEIWKKIEGYENYEVSNLGNVKSLNYLRTGKEQILKPAKMKNGYSYVFLSKNGKGKIYRVHRLVWEAFNGRIPEGYQVNHINERKNDNRLENLNLMTPKENCNYGTRNERSAKARTNGKRSKPVLQLDFDGNIIREWSSTREVERQTGYAQGNISYCCNGKYKYAYGFRWCYKKNAA